MSTAGIRFASASAAVSAVTTVLLWWLPRLYDAPRTFDETILLHENAHYIGRLWVNFVHVALALMAYGGTAYVLSRLAPTLAVIGGFSFLVWGFTELLGVTVNIFAVNRTWRAQFADASPETKVHISANLVGFEAVWDAMFFLLLVAFLLGSVCFGVAALHGRGLTRTVGVLFLFAAPLTAAILVGGYTSATGANAAVGLIYPILQPASRGVLAFWLWKAAEGSASPARAQTPA